MPAHPDVDPRPRPSMDTRKTAAPSGCRVRHCAGSASRLRGAPRTMSQPGSLGERDEVSSPGYEAGRRRAIGVVAALAIYPRATTLMARRWTDGTPCVPAVQEAGDEGIVRNRNRRSTTPKTPHSLGNAQPTSAILTGRLEARPTMPAHAHADLDPRPRPAIARGYPRPIGVPGTLLCRNEPSRRRGALRTMALPGSPGSATRS